MRFAVSLRHGSLLRKSSSCVSGLARERPGLGAPRAAAASGRDAAHSAQAARMPATRRRPTLALRHARFLFVQAVMRKRQAAAFHCARACADLLLHPCSGRCVAPPASARGLACSMARIWQYIGCVQLHASCAVRGQGKATMARVARSGRCPAMAVRMLVHAGPRRLRLPWHVCHHEAGQAVAEGAATRRGRDVARARMRLQGLLSLLHTAALGSSII